jgi:release factor glutamine methyltransferase
MDTTLLTIKEALEKSADYLCKKNSLSPRLDAEVLLSHVMGLPRLQLYLQFDRPLSESEREHYRALLKRRGDHEPVAYITGKKEFFSLVFQVTPAVLIPRPETEILVEQAIKRIEEWIKAHEGRFPRIFEVGAGSGAVSICLLHRFPDLEVTGSDINAEALKVAVRNADAHHVSERLQLIHGDLFAGQGGFHDFIISNPPYIAEAERDALAPDILRYEPATALFAGPEGLDMIERIILEGEKNISPDGWILVEIGKGQSLKLLHKIEEEKKFRVVQTVEDYTGLVRILCMMK